MTEALTVTRFEPGEAIPSWLIDADPGGPNAVAGKLTWGTQVDVIDAGDYYMVVPLGFGAIDPPVQFTGNGCKLFAPAKMVRVSTMLATFETVDKGMWRDDAPQLGIIQYPSAKQLFDAHVPPQGFASGQAEREMQRPDMQQLKHLEERKSLWKRIVAVFRP